MPEPSAPRSRSSFQQLEYILKIAEESSITKATEKLYVFQSALDQQPLILEWELGCQPSGRSHTDWHLTRVGEIYIEGAKRALFLKKEVYLKIHDVMESQKFQQTGFEPDILLETSSTPNIVAMVRSALYCGILPGCYTDPADSRMPCFVLSDYPVWDLCISYRKNSCLPRGAREFIRLVQEYWDRHLVSSQMDEHQ